MDIQMKFSRTMRIEDDHVTITYQLLWLRK